MIRISSGALRTGSFVAAARLATTTVTTTTTIASLCVCVCVYALFKFLSLLSHAKGRSRTAPSAWVLGRGRVDAAQHYGSACESTSQRGAVPRYVYKWRVTMQLALAAASSAVAHAMRNGIGMAHSELAFALARSPCLFCLNVLSSC